MKKQIYLFDLFDTILSDLKVDFNSGLRILYDNHFSKNCSFEEMARYGEELFDVLRTVQKSGEEFGFAQKEIPLFCEKFGVELFELGKEEECAIQQAVNEERFLPETRKLLEELKKAGNPMYILSNSIFREKALENCLRKYDALSFFKKVWSSADFGLRKPRREFFDMAVDEILKDNPGYEKSQITFVGNSYKYDAKGGVNAGLRTVWLNVKEEENTDNLPVRIIKEIGELIK